MLTTTLTPILNPKSNPNFFRFKKSDSRMEGKARQDGDGGGKKVGGESSEISGEKNCTILFGSDSSGSSNNSSDSDIIGDNCATSNSNLSSNSSSSVGVNDRVSQSR
jgi:hypothetical protein